MRGSVIGGQNPVKGAKIRLYQIGVGAGTSYTANATPLISSTVQTDAAGNFIITGLYGCTPGTYLYITAAGGDPGLGTSMNNNIAINEVTTDAMAYTFAQFGRTNLFGTALATQSAGALTTQIPGQVVGSDTVYPIGSSTYNVAFARRAIPGSHGPPRLIRLAQPSVR